MHPKKKERVILWLLRAVVFILLLGVAFFIGWNCAAFAAIPARADQYRATLIRTAHYTWGLDAPIAVFAAQIHTESRWKTDAKSPVGAVGLAQFMPATARWMPEIDKSLASPAPTNPGWAIRAMLRYNLWIWNQVQAANVFERMAFVLSSYNGGLGWVQKDKRMATSKGFDPARWFANVATVNAGRSKPNWRENREYPRQILCTFQQEYVQAGWGNGLDDLEGQCTGQ